MSVCNIYIYIHIYVLYIYIYPSHLSHPPTGCTESQLLPSSFFSPCSTFRLQKKRINTMTHHDLKHKTQVLKNNRPKNAAKRASAAKRARNSPVFPDESEHGGRVGAVQRSIQLATGQSLIQLCCSLRATRSCSSWKSMSRAYGKLSGRMYGLQD